MIQNTVSPAQALQIAIQHHNAGQLQQAEILYRQILQVEPDHPDALHFLGVILCQIGEFEKGIECFEKAVSISPNQPAYWYNAGVAFKEVDRIDKAIVYLGKAVQLKPDYVEAYVNLGVLFRIQGELNKAISCYRSALVIAPTLIDALNNIGVIYFEQKRFDDAMSSLNNALSVNGKRADVHNNLGLVCAEIGEYVQAEYHYRQALIADPSYVGVLNNMGNLFRDMGRPLEAIEFYKKALEEEKGLVEVQWNLSVTKLLLGDYQNGLALYEKRFEGGDEFEFAYSRSLLSWLAPVPRWRGEEMQGRTLLVWTEQGHGDSLMMMRYLPLLAGRGVGRLKVYCEPALVRLFQTQHCVEQAIGRDITPSLEGIDSHTPMLSLPYLFDTRLETIPAEFPYLEVPELLTQQWALRFPRESWLKVGLVWAGGNALRYDAKRSLNLEQFSPFMQTPGVAFYSLQKGDSAQQLTASNWPVTDWMDECTDFLDTAALVQQLDLVISVDTAVAHLAGALGKPVWLLNRFESEWRWMLEREDTPWYPGLRQFRQTTPGDWGGVIARIADELARKAAEHGESA